MSQIQFDNSMLYHAPSLARIATWARLGKHPDVLKAVTVFGQQTNTSITVPQTVWAGTGAFVYLAAAQTLRVVSTSALDTFGGAGANFCQITGLNAAKNEIVETVTMAGTVPVTTTNSFIRVNQVVTFGGTTAPYNNLGVITGATLSPVTTQFVVPIGYNTSPTAIYSVPAGFTGYQLGDVVAAYNSSLTSATRIAAFTIGIQVVPLIGFVPFDYRTDENSTASSTHSIPVMIPSTADIEIRAVASGANTTTSARMDILLINNNYL